MEYRYDIKQFNWNKDTNTFGADAWDLVAHMPDGSIHPEAFPNMKKQFFIHNYKTNGFRRFRFVRNVVDSLIDETDGSKYKMLFWLFESEDGIKCYICVEP
jgi:hypothetical protein